MLLVLHRELAFSGGQASQFHCVTEHLAKRNIGFQDEEVSSGFCFGDGASSFEDACHDFLVDVLVDVDFDVHQGLEDLLVGTDHCLVEGITSGNSECIGRGIDNVGGSVFEDETSVDDWVSGLRAFENNIVEGLANCSHVLWWNVGTNNFTDKLIAGFISFRIDWLNVPNDSGILTSSSRLLLMQIIEILPLSDGFPVIDSRLTSCALHSKLSSDPLDIDLKMQLSHSTDDHLLGFLVNIDGECRILSFEFRQSLF